MQRTSGAPLPREERLKTAIRLIDEWAAELVLRAAKGIIPPMIPYLYIGNLMPYLYISGLMRGLDVWEREDLRIRTTEGIVYRSDIDNDLQERWIFWIKASERFAKSIIDKDFYKSDDLTAIRSTLVGLIKTQGPRYDFWW